MNASPEIKHPATKGMIVIATLLVVVSLWVLYSEVPGEWASTRDDSLTRFSHDPVLAILRLATVGAGITTAIGLWSAKRWAFWSYLVWLAFSVAFEQVTESRLGAGVWWLVVGAAIGSIILALPAYYLYKNRL